MNNNLISLQSRSTAEHAMVFTKNFEGKLFTVRAFFPVDGADTMQRKIERMLRSDIMNAARNSVASNAYQAC